MEIKNEFKAHLDSLAKLPLYQMVDNVLKHRTRGKIKGGNELEEDEETVIQVFTSTS